MATWQEISQSIIENHEKLNYDENPGVRQRVLKSLTKAVKHAWSKADWTFKVREAMISYDPAAANNALPEDFLSFQHTGHVYLSDADGVATKELEYKPFNQLIGMLRGPGSESGSPEFYSLGGSTDGEGTIRSIFLYPKPNTATDLNLIYQAKCPSATLDTWTEEIPSIPETWHESVLEEIAILFRMIDKGADVSVQTGIVATALEAMKRDEPHGRGDVVMMQPAYAWRMNVRY